jgi:hypothetical protein
MLGVGGVWNRMSVNYFDLKKSRASIAGIRSFDSEHGLEPLGEKGSRLSCFVL